MQLIVTYGKRLTGQKRRNYNYPSKYYFKKWNQAPGGQNGGIITKIRQVTNLGFIQTTDVSGDTVDCFAFRFPVTIESCQIMRIINICTICIES